LLGINNVDYFNYARLVSPVLIFCFLFYYFADASLILANSGKAESFARTLRKKISRKEDGQNREPCQYHMLATVH